MLVGEKVGRKGVGIEIESVEEETELTAGLTGMKELAAGDRGGEEERSG